MSQDNKHHAARPTTAKFVVTLDVTYDLDGEALAAMKSQLLSSIRNMVGQGGFSGCTRATVDAWGVTTVEGQDGPQQPSASDKLADPPVPALQDGAPSVRDEAAQLCRSLTEALRARPGAKVKLSDMQEALAQATGLGTWRTIAALKGHQTVPAESQSTAPEIELKVLMDVAYQVVDSADNAGCEDDLTVTSASAVENLTRVLQLLISHGRYQQERTPGTASTTANTTVYVQVSGEPSEDDDEDLPGVYAMGVTVVDPSGIDLGCLNKAQEHAIAQAVLDEFHDQQGIECLDDFTIRLIMPSGADLREADDAEELSLILMGLLNISTQVEHVGKLDDQDLPPAVRKTL